MKQILLSAIIFATFSIQTMNAHGLTVVNNPKSNEDRRPHSILDPVNAIHIALPFYAGEGQIDANLETISNKAKTDLDSVYIPTLLHLPKNTRVIASHRDFWHVGQIKNQAFDYLTEKLGGHLNLVKIKSKVIYNSATDADPIFVLNPSLTSDYKYSLALFLHEDFIDTSFFSKYLGFEDVPLLDGNWDQNYRFFSPSAIVSNRVGDCVNITSDWAKINPQFVFDHLGCKRLITIDNSDVNLPANLKVWYVSHVFNFLQDDVVLVHSKSLAEKFEALGFKAEFIEPSMALESRVDIRIDGVNKAYFAGPSVTYPLVYGDTVILSQPAWILPGPPAIDALAAFNKRAVEIYSKYYTNVKTISVFGGQFGAGGAWSSPGDIVRAFPWSCPDLVDSN